MELLEQKNNQEGTKKRKNKTKKVFSFRMFFTKYTWYGLSLILVSIIIDILINDNVNDDTIIFFATIFISLLSTLGIALFIGAIFDFSKNTEAFTLFVTNIMKKIVVSKDFLGIMTETEKENSLELILKPTNVQMEQCSSINMYYKKSIKSFMELYRKPFKTGLTINVTIKKEKKVFVMRGELLYRTYKVDGKYQPEVAMFDTESGIIENTQLIAPDGKEKILSIDNGISKTIVYDKSKTFQYIEYKTEIPADFCEYPYITVKKEICEKGYDHWFFVSWSSLTPCDGITFFLNCMDGANVKSHYIFDDESLYQVNIDSKTNVSITSASWLDTYTGFSIVVSDTKADI